MTQLFLISGAKRKLFALYKEMFSCLPPEPQHERGHNLVMLGQNTWCHVASQVSLHHILSLYSRFYINQLSNQTHVFLYQAQEAK